MGKGLKVILKILETIICIPLAIAGAVCLTPFVIFGLIIGLPIAVVQDIWEVHSYR